MTSQTIWFTSDTHFFHKSILFLGRGRPFSDYDEMNEVLIERWNECVKRQDRIYHLGDFSFKTHTATRAILDRLNGQKHFVRGNHDSSMDKLKDCFDSYQNYKEIKVGDQRLVLFHFPILSWHQVHKGSWHLHGHCHGNLPEDPAMARMDVGVDTHDFRPWHYDEIAERLSGRSGLPGDHHSGTSN